MKSLVFEEVHLVSIAVMERVKEAEAAVNQTNSTKVFMNSIQLLHLRRMSTKHRLQSRQNRLLLQEKHGPRPQYVSHPHDNSLDLFSRESKKGRFMSLVCWFDRID